MLQKQWKLLQGIKHSHSEILSQVRWKCHVTREGQVCVATLKTFQLSFVPEQSYLEEVNIDLCNLYWTLHLNTCGEGFYLIPLAATKYIIFTIIRVGAKYLSNVARVLYIIIKIQYSVFVIDFLC